jgi:enolase
LRAVFINPRHASASGVGDEGGFAPPIQNPEEALELLMAAIEAAGYTGKIHIGLDPPFSELTRDGSYDIGWKDKSPKVLSPKEMAALWDGLPAKYPIVLLEDPFAEDDWDSWTDYNERCEIELVGDDLVTTTVEREKVAHKKGACNSMLLKVNQIGTISESIEA